MEAILAIVMDLVYQYPVIYMDNIIIYYRVYAKYIRDLKKLLQWFKEPKFYLKQSKYQFFTRKLNVVVYILISDELHINAKKRNTILEFLTPLYKKDLCGFLEVGNYILQLLTELAFDTSTLLQLQRECTNYIWTAILN